MWYLIVKFDSIHYLWLFSTSNRRNNKRKNIRKEKFNERNQWGTNDSNIEWWQNNENKATSIEFGCCFDRRIWVELSVYVMCAFACACIPFEFDMKTLSNLISFVWFDVCLIIFDILSLYVCVCCHC